VTGGGGIEVAAVTHRFQGRAGVVEALAGVDLRVAPAEFLTIVGPSGCGKSTLLRLVAGLLRPTAGRVTVDGAAVERPHPEVGIVFQQPALLPWRSVERNIALQVEMRGRDPAPYRPRIAELIRLTGLQGFERSLPHELSGGMQQRVSLCRALVHDPTLLLMDEPFGALDAMTREALSLELQRVWMQRRKTVLFVTHSIAEAIFLGDRVAVMTPRPGRIARTVEVHLPRPRRFADLAQPAFTGAMGEVRGLLDAAVAAGAVA
jgi:NitT/TauT family transport system ATP-binding protein